MEITGETKELEVRAAMPRPAAASGAGAAFDVAIHENEIPDFAGPALERLYESVYCTLERFRIYGEAQGASTYVARSGDAIACLILFRIEGRVVKVINQQVALAAADLRCFAETIFARYPRAQRISFYAIDTRIEQFPYPFQAFEALEENVLRLPASAAEYDSRISQNLTKRLQSAEKKLRRDFRGYEFQVLERSEVSEELLRKIAGLAGARMAAKQQDAYIQESDIGRILQLIHAYGYVGVLRLDGEVRGGNVFYGVGQRYFMHIIAHDPGYDKYMLGHLVQYLAACHCIKLGGRECCLMGGGRENKARFGASAVYLSSVDIYRSRWQRLSSVRRACAAALRRALHQARQHLARTAQADGVRGRMAARLLALLRSRKQHKPGAAQ